MVYDKARELANMLSQSDEYVSYKAAQDKAFANETTISLHKEYAKLRVQAQGAIVSGKKDDASLERLQKIGEILQLDQDASAYLIAEYRLNTMLGDVYKILAEAIQVDFGFGED